MKAYKAERSFSIVTFGCKLNQFESELIRESFLRAGWVEKDFEEGADVVVVNTCTVTAKSDARGRNAVRRAKRSRADSKVIVTGCYAETQWDVLMSMDEVDLVVGNDEKKAICSMAERILGGADIGEIEKSTVQSENSTFIESFFEHSRAFIKIQEGCNSACSYCIIPRARGRSRSVRPEQVVRQVELLKERGFREVVLTGIHIGRYGRDLESGIRLADLVETILQRVGGVRLRLSSIEVNEIDARLLKLMRESKFFASHLHIPMQSGDDEILGAMRRPYTSSIYAEKIIEVHESVPGIAIGSDVIVGFPGERERHFENTLRLAQELPINYFHIFSFSQRPGTDAAGFPDQVPPEIKKSRSRKLRRLSRKKRNEFTRSQVGTRHEVLVQGSEGYSSRFMKSLTGNYCEVYIRCSDDLKGRLVSAFVSNYSKGRLYGRLISSSEEGIIEARLKP